MRCFRCKKGFGLNSDSTKCEKITVLNCLETKVGDLSYCKYCAKGYDAKLGKCAIVAGAVAKEGCYSYADGVCAACDDFYGIKFLQFTNADTNNVKNRMKKENSEKYQAIFDMKGTIVKCEKRRGCMYMSAKGCHMCNAFLGYWSMDVTVK